ncbi:MAG: ABC transporter substrate-binding protein [Caldilineaceae bacterium]
MSRRAFLRSGINLSSTLLLAACGFWNRNDDAATERVAAAERELVLEVQHPFGGATMDLLEQVWAAYEAQNNGVGINAVPAPNDLSTNQKLFTDIAAGVAPDVTWVDGPQVAEWAEREVLQDISAYFEGAGLSENDFWAPCWRQNFYNGKVWAITYTADANFGFFWNKRVFAKAGLDPEQPPTTIDELTHIHKEITLVDGGIRRMGILPWNTYGSANAMFTWGWLFGGDFFDADANRITADHERNVMALAWMQQLIADVGGYEEVARFQADFGAGAETPFFMGQEAMRFYGPWELANIEQYAPDLAYGITQAPAGPPPALPNSSWVGGWCAGMPVGARHPDAAWDFLHWLCATDGGTELYGRLFMQFPGYQKSSWYAKLPQERPQLVPFLDILTAARHQRPVMPAQAFFMGALQQNVDAALRGEKSAMEALHDAAESTQRELEQILQR